MMGLVDVVVRRELHSFTDAPDHSVSDAERVLFTAPRDYAYNFGFRICPS